MATAAKKGNGSTPLGSAAMLVCVAVHQFGNRVVERELAEKTAHEHNAEAQMFFTTKKLVAREAISKVSTMFARFKVFHYENTLPWLDNGYRILPAANYAKYVEEARRLKEEAMAAVEDFLKVYPTVREQAQKKLGTAFRESDYPTPAQLRSRWGIEINFTPIPDKADFRADIPAKELAVITANIDAQVKTALHNAQQDLFQRLYQVVLAMRDKVKDYKVTEARGKKKIENAFRDSAITNIRDLCELLPRLNFTNDPELSRLADEVKKGLASQEPDALREDEDLRNKAVRKADDLLKKMAAYIGDTV